METRVLTNITATLTDQSTAANDYYAQDIPCVLDAGDYLYIGQRHPFNHIYFKVTTGNTNTSVFSGAAWDGSTWQNFVDIQDETSGFTNSGFISWTPNKYEGWHREDTVDNASNEKVTGLGTVTIYDRFWVRLQVDAVMSAGTDFRWVGNIFASDNQIQSQYPELMRSDYLAAFSATTWEEQSMIGAKQLIKDLIGNNIMNFKGQVLEREKFELAAVHQVAKIIYRALGDDYEDNFLRAHKSYMDEVAKGVLIIDRDEDGVVDRHETCSRNGALTR